MQDDVWFECYGDVAGGWWHGKPLIVLMVLMVLTIIGVGDHQHEDDPSPIELSERSSMVVSGAKKWGTWARLAEVQETDAVTGEQEHLGG